MFKKINSEYGNFYIHIKTLEYIEVNDYTIDSYFKLCKDENVCPFKMIGYLNNFFIGV